MSVANGKAKLAARASSMTSNYNAAKGTMPADYAAGLADAGVTVGPNTQRKYQEGVARAQYQYTAGHADKWERNYLRGMSR